MTDSPVVIYVLLEKQASLKHPLVNRHSRLYMRQKESALVFIFPSIHGFNQTFAVLGFELTLKSALIVKDHLE